jgi:glycogen operon protein
MLMAGDERNRTQQGNNNTYCQDNALSWLDWRPDPTADSLTTFVQALTSLRADIPALRINRYPEPGVSHAGEPVPGTGLDWFNPDGQPVTGADWDNCEGHSFGILFSAPGSPSVAVLLNAYWGAVPFTLPSAPSGSWTLVLDTTAEDGRPASTVAAPGTPVPVGPRSVIVATSGP